MSEDAHSLVAKAILCYVPRISERQQLLHAFFRTNQRLLIYLLSRRAFQSESTEQVRRGCSPSETRPVAGSANALPSLIAPLPVWACSGPGTPDIGESVARTWTARERSLTQSDGRNKATSHHTWKANINIFTGIGELHLLQSVAHNTNSAKQTTMIKRSKNRNLKRDFKPRATILQVPLWSKNHFLFFFGFQNFVN